MKLSSESIWTVKYQLRPWYQHQNCSYTYKNLLAQSWHAAKGIIGLDAGVLVRARRTNNPLLSGVMQADSNLTITVNSWKQDHTIEGRSERDVCHLLLTAGKRAAH